MRPRRPHSSATSQYLGDFKCIARTFYCSPDRGVREGPANGDRVAGSLPPPRHRGRLLHHEMTEAMAVAKRPTTTAVSVAIGSVSGFVCQRFGSTAQTS